jgi:NAD(P)-dependent dehydrogenase (short-subunit alcohol dehydrogenase family)
MGLACAQLLASRGAILSLADINEKAMEEVIQTIQDGDRHMMQVVDVSNSESVDSWIANTVDKLGKLDGAVNIAGIITTATPVTEVSNENWDFTFAVNVRGVFNCLRAQLRVMKDGGSIVSTLSSGYIPTVQHQAVTICLRLLSGFSGKCLWTVRCSWEFGLLCQQGCCHRSLENCSKGEPVYSN